MDGYLLRATDIAAMPGEAKTHFQNPNAQRINKSLGDATGLNNMGFHIIEVQPGRESTEYHMHWFEEECVFVLNGQATATIGDENFPIGPGDFIGYRAGGLAHTITNTGDQVFRCIVAGQRLDHDVGDYPRKGHRLFRQGGMPWQIVNISDVTDPKA